MKKAICVGHGASFSSITGNVHLYLFSNMARELIIYCFSELSSSSSSSSSDEEEEQYHDGWDENLIGDEADRSMLEKMTEKEREQEIFNRVEKREALKTRFEIERKAQESQEEREEKEKRQRKSQLV